MCLKSKMYVMAVKDKIDVRDAILAHLEANKRSLAWLAEETGYNYNTMYSIFKQKTINLSADKLQKINFKLGTSFKK